MMGDRVRRPSQASRVVLAGLLTYLQPAEAGAGPPFMTDDPEPTETGHWEIYGPIVEGEGRGSAFEGSTGVEINYGAAPALQITLGLPAQFSHDHAGWRWGAGDVAVSAKYRFYHNEQSAFPSRRSRDDAPHREQRQGRRQGDSAFPIWLQKNAGAWSIFGGGG